MPLPQTKFVSHSSVSTALLPKTVNTCSASFFRKTVTHISTI